MLRDELTALLEPVVRGLGYELWELEYGTRQGGALLRLYIDRPGRAAGGGRRAGAGLESESGITVDDCARVSHAVSEVMDAEDPVAGYYTLEVSSPGLDRVLRTRAHFARFVGRAVRVEMKAPIGGRKRFLGRLLQARMQRTSCLMLGADGGEVALPSKVFTRPGWCRSCSRGRENVARSWKMNKEILMVVDAVSNEKSVDKEIIFEALEAALASATRKRHGEGIDVRVAINRKTGDYDTFRRWKVFADDSTELEFPDQRAAHGRCRGHRQGRAAGRLCRSADGIRGVRTHRRADGQAGHRAESARSRACAGRRTSIKDRVGTMVSGLVKRVDRSGIFVDLGGNAEGFIPREHMIPREPVRAQDRIKAYLKEVRSEQRGPQLFLSRTAPEFLIELFKLEVPEVGQGLINILARHAIRASAPRLPCEQRSAHRSGRRLRRYARFARAGRVE